MAKTKGRTKPPREDDNSFVAPSVRVFTEWDPPRLRSAQASAETGVLSSAVLVCEWLLTDDRVVGTLDARCDALLGLEPTFEPSGDRRRSNRAVKALEAGEDFWAAYPDPFLRVMLKWGLLLGVAPARHGWKGFEDHGGRLLPMPQFWHPQTLRYDQRQRAWFVRDDRNNELRLTLGDESDGSWILHTPFGLDRPWAYGLWRSLARWVLLKHYAILDWARHGEKASVLVATSPDGASKEQRKELAEDLQASGSDRIVALAAGFDLKLVEVNANTKQIYEAQVRAADEAIAILVRGGNLSTMVDGGSRAAAEVQAEKGDEPKLRFDASGLASTLNEQSLSWWSLFNFGAANLAPWPMWPVEPEEDKGKRATTVKTLGEGLTVLDKLGYEFDDKALIEGFGLDFITGRKSPEQRAKESADAKPEPTAPVDPNAPVVPDPKKTPKPKK